MRQVEFKAAILGCGMIAGLYETFDSDTVYSHARAFHLNPEISAVAYYDPLEERAKSLASRFGGQVFNDPIQILEEFKPDFISICSPDSSHAELLINLLQHALCPPVIFCEKPLVLNQAELSSVLAASTNRPQVQIIVNHSRRFDSAHWRLRELIESKSLGELVGGHIEYYSGWQHLAVHVVDTLQFLFNTTIEIKSSQYYAESRFKGDPVLHVDALLNTAPLRIQGNKEEYFQILEFNLKFEKGMIRTEDFGQDIRVFRKTVNAEKENVLLLDKQHSGPGMVSPIQEAVEIIIKYLKEPEKKSLQFCGLEEANRTMQTIWQGIDLCPSI